MALTDTFMKLAIDRTHSAIANIPDAQKSAMVLHIGPGNVAYQPHQFDEIYQKTLNTPGGGAIFPDNASLIVGAKAPFYMSISQLGIMNISQVQELYQVVKKGLVIPTVINKGTTVGDASTEWRDGFIVTADEIRTYFIEPRTVWTGVTAAQADPTADIDDFIYLPAYPTTTPIVEVIQTAGPASTFDVQIWAYNPSEGTVALVLELIDKAESFRIKLQDVEFNQYLIPIISRIGSGTPTLDINVGMQIARI